MTALRIFLPDESEPRKKRAHRLPAFLRWPEAMRLIDWCAAEVARLEAMPRGCTETRHHHWRGAVSKIAAARRDEIIARVGLYLGLRVTEIADLDVADVDLAARSVFVRQGKGNRDRYVRISEKLAPFLQSWIGERREGILIEGRNGRRVHGRTIRWRLARAARLAGIAVHVHPHLLRHTFATHFLETGGNIRNLQALLGHSDLATTAVYLDVDVSRFAADVDRL